jgi:hypothetical protein
MPKGPRGEKRPGDVIGAAIMVAKIATGEVEEDQKDASAQALGRKGGKARVAKLTSQQRSASAQAAAKARWQKP